MSDVSLKKSAIIPDHVGVILDGNRRWAKANGLRSLEGHRRGSDVFKDISLHLFDKGVSVVSAYVFSTENWQRTAEEIDYLMRLVIKAVENHLVDYNRFGIRVRILGARDKLKPNIVKALEKTEEKTASNTQGTLALCFNYGGKTEVVDAVKKIVEQEAPASKITEKTISDHLYASDIPDVDLLVRTSGEKRLSGFMLWRSPYAELAFTDTYWPDMTTDEFDEILENYSNRQRRFGK